MNNQPDYCPCGNPEKYVDCCGRYIDGAESPLTAEALMRSRYTAYVLERNNYLLATWHHSTRPVSLDLTAESRCKWIGLEVKRHQYDPQNPDHAVVEFVARYKVGGRAHRLHEISRFVREAGHWFYLDGDVD